MEKIINYRILRVQILVAYICLFLSISVQAQNSWISLPSGEKITAGEDEPQCYYYEIENGEVKIRKMEDPKDVVKVIVTLKDKPIALYKSKKGLRKVSLMSVLSSLKQTHSSVSSKIEQIASRLSSGSNFKYSFKINREYFTGINGMAMECNREMIRHIRELPEVKSVHLDREVKACLTESVKQIRADIVQDSLGYSGEGVLVGVIDTGIDFNHPALGGGYGPGYRVTGGYDFFNDDSDPLDDNGHGTHVAGIIGANGNSNQIGVAPDVKFLAVKVLNVGGSGPWSAVIAGIEYCMDPDGNPETDDAVDIMNLSLGGWPVPDNPVDAAVDNATQAGILSVIAAGNEGYNPFLESTFQTIGTPGTTETALTVGACHSFDFMANFSSKGPDPINFAIKPEVSAPGVDIHSLYLRNMMEIMSGTSMAAPHASGVAALLKEQHPDWTPGQIKAAIINSAKPSLESLFARGNGRVDALNAATLGILVEPGTVSFGLVDLTEAVWMDTVEIKVKNLRNVSQNFNLENHSYLPTEAALYLSQTSFELAPMEEKEITAIISVPQSVAIKQTSPFAYTGSIICQSDSDTVELPFSFIKSHVVVIECDLEPYDLTLYYGPYRDHWVEVLRRTGGIDNKYTAAVQNRTYTLQAWFRERDTTNKISYDYHIVRNNVKVKGLTQLTLNHSEAEFAAFNGVDQAKDIYDNPVRITDSSRVNFDIIEMHPGYISIRSMHYVGWKYNELRIFFSPLDETYIIHQDVLINNGDQALLLGNFAKGVKSQDDLTLLSGSQNLGDLHLNLDYTRSYDRFGNPLRGGPYFRAPYVQLDKIEIGDKMEEGWGFSSGHALPNRNYVHFMANKLTTEFNPMQYLTMSIGIGNYSEGCFGFSLPPASTATSDFYINDSRDIVFFERKFFRPDQSESVNIMTLSSGDTLYLSEKNTEGILVPKFQFLYPYGDYKDLVLTQFSPNLFDDSGICYSNGIHRQILYLLGAYINFYLEFDSRMYSRNRLLEKNYVLSSNYMLYYNYSVEENANRYRLVANTRPFTLLGQRGQTTIDYEFNVTESIVSWKCFMPSLDLFQILENGKTAQRLHPGQDKKIRLVIFDPKENVDSVSISLLKNDGSEIELTTTQASQKEYFASIPDNIPGGFLDAIARVHNAEGNKFELTVSPAFYSGSTLDSLYDARLQMVERIMNNPDSVEFIAGDTLKYTLTFINYGNRVAEDITVNFPETDYFVPIGNTSVNIDSMLIEIKGKNNKYEIPLKLLFRGNKQADEKQCYYYPTITWKSGERTFTRKHKILVNFEGTLTQISAFENTVPNTYVLSQNFPNPFNPSTTINYTIPQKTKVKLEIFNTLGQKVATLVDDTKPAGKYVLIWKPTDLPSGVYFYRLNAGIYSETKKLVLLK